MEMMEETKGYSCLNKYCRFYSQHNQGNILIKTWLGPNKDVRLLYCKECKRHFSEDQNTFALIY